MYFLQFAFSQHPTAFNEPPSWAKNAIWYQLFVERFYNGDKQNDPKSENTTVNNMNIVPPKDWETTPWTTNWYLQEKWMQQTEMPFNDWVQYRRYGGDLQGVLNKLNYLQELGINALFINPMNDAPSLHKYDARNYHHIDVNFGPDPEGDIKTIASESPNVPDTWKWTAADKLFLRLIDEAHKRGMKIIMDYSWNHTGTLFWAWDDILKNQSESQFKEWYNITSFDNPETEINEFSYEGWYGNDYMPEFRKTDIKSERKNGIPYEGNINEGAKQHIFDVTRRWLAPNGDKSHGVDGFRLDVADQIGLEFWREYREFVRSVQPDAYLIGEIWWESWPDKLMDPAPYTKGDIFDAVMYYQVYRPARYFFAKTNHPIDAQQLRDSLEFHWSSLEPSFAYAMMNVSSSHDAPRLLTDFYNPNKYKFHANPNEDPGYKTGKPDKESYNRLKLYLIHLFTTIGTPQIWNGEEMGMWGSDDPNCRKPLWWKEFNFDKETRNNTQPGRKTYDKVKFHQSQFDFYKLLINIRKNNPVLAQGELEFLLSKGNKLVYKRFDKKNEIIVIFNMEATNQNFDLPQHSTYTELLGNKKITGNRITLKAFSAVILKNED
jgi:glycosidase